MLSNWDGTKCRLHNGTKRLAAGPELVHEPSRTIGFLELTPHLFEAFQS